MDKRRILVGHLNKKGQVVLSGIIRKLRYSFLYRSLGSLFLLFVFLGGWYAWCYHPMECLVKQKKQSLIALTKQKEILAAIKKDIERINFDCEQLSKKISEALCKKQQADLQVLFKKVVLDAEASGLSILSCSPRPITITPYYKKQTLEVRALGSFFEIYDFLLRTKEYDFFSKISQMSIQHKDDTLLLECTIQAYKVE
jgi:Tfp pilus assembly protein PilO